MNTETREILRGFGRTLTSMLITGLFLIALLVGSAQQQAMVALQRSDLKLSYSVARKLVREAGAEQQRLRGAMEAQSRLNNEKRLLDIEYRELEIAAYSAQNAFDALVLDVRRHGTCPEIAANPDAPTPPMLTLWNGMTACARDERMPKKASAVFEELQAPDHNLPKLIQAAERKRDAQKYNQSKIEELAGDINGYREAIKGAEAAQESLQDVSILDENPLLGARVFSWLPPALMQILLCFVSGLFGALLITLILVVYPNNDFSFVGSNSYWSRILLGGLIAVGVFVVIGGGVAVLGSSQSLMDGSANYLSFCAIGLLAGMFSDRVARWLSARADAFIQQNSGSGGGSDKAATVDPAVQPAG